VLDVSNLALNVIFLLEALIKCFALSFEAYVKDPLNKVRQAGASTRKHSSLAAHQERILS